MKTTYIWGIVIGLFIGLIVILSLQKEKAVYHYRTVTNEEAIEMLAREEVTILDVRTKLEYNSGHIKGALHIPLESIDEQFPKLFTDKNAYYLIYCQSGSRSQKASKKLATLGYQNVYDFGSIDQWDGDLVKDQKII